MEFNSKVICATDIVCVRILDNADDMNIDGVYVPKSFGFNERLAFAKIESLGPKAKSEYGLEVGDYVMIDRLATFGHTQPIAMLTYNNVICKTDANSSDYFPVKDMIFVKADPKTEEKINDIYVVHNEEKIKFGTIVKTNFSEKSDYEKQEFTIGSRIILTKCDDVVYVGEDKLFIYKKENIICKVLEDE